MRDMCTHTHKPHKAQTARMCQRRYVQVMLGGPIPATRSALEKAKLSIDQIGLYEVGTHTTHMPTHILMLLADRCLMPAPASAMVSCKRVLTERTRDQQSHRIDHHRLR